MKKIRLLEVRTLPELEEKRNNLLDELDDMLEKSKQEQRDFSSEEQNKWNKVTREIDLLNKKLKKAEDEHERNLNKGRRTENRTLKDAILPNEKLEKRHYQKDHMDLDLGELVKVMAGRGDSRSNEDKYYRSMSSAGNKMLIPQQLADQIIDVARSQSAIFGNIPVVQMPSNNLKIVVQTGDAVANFVNEGELIPTSDPIFQAVDLEGQTLALFVPVSEQLLNSTMNLTSQLMYSCSQAIAQALDKAVLYGKGTGNDPKEIKGLCTYDTINKEAHNDDISYDAIIKGIKAVKKNNIEPTNVCYSSVIGSDLAMLKDGTGQYINEPKLLENYMVSESNNLKEKDLLIYDRGSLLMGIHEGITIEWGHSADMFQRIQKGLRIYLRADLGVIRPKGITLVSTTVRGIDEEIYIKNSKTK